MAPNPRHGGESGELCVGLVKNDDCIARGLENFAQCSGSDKGAGGIIGVGQKKDPWALAQRDENLFQRKTLLRVVAARFDARTSDFRIVAIHGKSWLTDKNVRSRLDKSVEEHAQRVVAAVS